MWVHVCVVYLSADLNQHSINIPPDAPAGWEYLCTCVRMCVGVFVCACVLVRVCACVRVCVCAWMRVRVLCTREKACLKKKERQRVCVADCCRK